MFILGIAVGTIVGNIMGIVWMCRMVTGKRADEEMEHLAPQIHKEEGQVMQCENETM